MHWSRSFLSIGELLIGSSCIVLLSLSSVGAQSPDDKGWVIGSRLAQSLTQSDLITEIAPFVGYQIHRKWLLGTELGYRYRRNRQDPIPPLLGFPPAQRQLKESVSNAYHMGIWIRHVVNPDSRIQVFIQPQLRYRYREVESTYHTPEPATSEDQNLFYASTEIGLATTLWRRWTFNLHLIDIGIESSANNTFSYFEAAETPLFDFSIGYRLTSRQ